MLPAQAESGPIKILIVEDDKYIYNACYTLLKHYEFEVMLATTLADGKRFLSAKPNLVLLDLSLPDGDGAQLLECIRTTGLQTKVFILTGDTSKETQRKIRRWLPDQFFNKPLNFLDILEAIRLQLKPDSQNVTQTLRMLDGKKHAALKN